MCATSELMKLQRPVPLISDWGDYAWSLFDDPLQISLLHLAQRSRDDEQHRAGRHSTPCNTMNRQGLFHSRTGCAAVISPLSSTSRMCPARQKDCLPLPAVLCRNKLLRETSPAPQALGGWQGAHPTLAPDRLRAELHHAVFSHAC